MSLFPETSFQLEIAKELGSTNQVLLERSMEKDFHGSALMALRQTAGKGRRGRSWESLEGNLALSMGLSLPENTYASLLPFLAGISLFKAISQNLVGIDSSLSLKWPNDIYLQRKKLGGMLAQAKQLSGEVRFVLGIGVNLQTAPTQTRVPAIALAEILPETPSPKEFAAAFLREMESALRHYREPREICNDWQSCCGHMGKEIVYFTLENPEQKHRATAKEIGLTGELIVFDHASEREKILTSEEVSLELLL